MIVYRWPTGKQNQLHLGFMHSICPLPTTVYLSASCLSLYVFLSPYVSLCHSICLSLPDACTNHQSPGDGRRLWFSVLMLRQNWTGPLCLLNTNIVHKHSFMFYQNHKYLGDMLHWTVADLGSKIQTSNEITNTRETAELDTSFFENNYYHQWELVMFCFSEWHYNTMVMFCVWITMGLFFPNLNVKWKNKISHENLLPSC